MKEFGYFTASLGLHGLLILIAFTSQNETPKLKEQPFQVELIDNSPKTKNPRMVLNDLADKLEDVEKKATALSDKKRRVELERRKKPQRFGLNAPIKKQKAAQKGPDGQTKKRPSKKFSKKDFWNDPNGIAYQQRDRKPLDLPLAARSGLTTPRVPRHIIDSLPQGIELGNISALNTDQHLFYNFHSRLIGGFAPLWGELVGQTVYHWLQNNSFPKVSRSWVTNVEVILDKNGEVLDVQHYRLSGLWPFDEAPVKAFKRLKQIPNPPAEMVGEDGYIRLKFQTEVHWRPRPAGGLNFSRGQGSSF